MTSLTQQMSRFLDLGIYDYEGKKEKRNKQKKKRNKQTKKERKKKEKLRLGDCCKRNNFGLTD